MEMFEDLEIGKRWREGWGYCYVWLMNDVDFFFGFLGLCVFCVS